MISKKNCLSGIKQTLTYLIQNVRQVDDGNYTVLVQMYRKQYGFGRCDWFIDRTMEKSLWRFIIYIRKGSRKINVVYLEDNFVPTGARMIIIWT